MSLRVTSLLITLVIVKITWDSWRTIRASEPGELVSLCEPVSLEARVRLNDH